MDKKVSIIIPCYNGGKFIDRSIASVYQQNYDNIQLIVVDDGSTDDSWEHIQQWIPKFRAKNCELLYIYQDNMGSGGAINTGLKHVSGDYISLLDADDEYLEDIIIERVDYLEKHPLIDVVRSNGYIINGDYKTLFINDASETGLDNVFEALLAGRTNNWAGSYMVRANALFQFYPDREIYVSRYGQNLQFLLPLVYKKACGYIECPHMNYIRQPESLSQSSDQLVKKQKSISNANGYRDIREHMMECIVSDADEREHYRQIIQYGYESALMAIAIEFKDKELMKQSFGAVRKYATLNDRILYYNLIFPPYALVLRTLRKIKCLWE